MGQKEIGAELRQDWELKEVQTGNVDLILKTNKQTNNFCDSSEVNRVESQTYRSEESY